jgi:radical SAM superfamily enzyme YgiQ (UPF0313 family)
MPRCDVVLVGYEDEENLGLRYIAAYLGSRGVRAEIAPYRAGVRGPLLAFLRARRPKVVGFSLIFQGMLPDFAELIAFLRAGGVRAHFTIGGHFPTIAWERTLRIIPGLDSVVRHEGEQTLLELVRRVDRPATWPGIAGLAYRRRGRAVVTPPRPLIPDLDALPPPTRRAGALRSRGVGIASLIASRGCYYDCAFCSIRSFYRDAPGPTRRTRSPANVADEMEALHRGQGVRVFIFKDDDLATRGARAREWIGGFANELRRRGLDRAVAWRISCRVDDLDPEALRMLREVGLTWVYLGIESGSEQGLRTLNKRFGVADIRKGIARLRALGLAFDYGFMLLEPDSTLATVSENVDFLDRLGRRGDVSIHFTKMYPYVGTPLAARLAAEGRLGGTEAQPDYRFLDPRLDLFQGFLAEAFHVRNFAAAGLVSVGRMAAFDIDILRRFHPGRRGLMAYAAAVRRITTEGNAVAVSALRKVLTALGCRFVEECLAMVPQVREVARIARETDRGLSEQLRRVMEENGWEAPHYDATPGGASSAWREAPERVLTAASVGGVRARQRADGAQLEFPA